MKYLLIISGWFLLALSSPCKAQTHEAKDTKIVGTPSTNQPVHEALITSPAPGQQMNHDTHESIELQNQAQLAAEKKTSEKPLRSQHDSTPSSGKLKVTPGSTDDTPIIAVKNTSKTSPSNGAASSVDEPLNMKSNTNKPLQPVVSGKSSVDD